MDLQNPQDSVFHILCENHGIPYPHVKMKVKFELYGKFGVYMRKLGSASRKCVDFRFRLDFRTQAESTGFRTPMSKEGHDRILRNILCVYAKT